jgi:hypothetical protein
MAERARERKQIMTRLRQIINASKLGEHGLRLIGTTDIDGNETTHEITDVDPIVLFDFATFNTRDELPFRLHAGGLYYVHAGSPAFHRAQGLVGHRRGHTDRKRSHADSQGVKPKSKLVHSFSPFCARSPAQASVS